MNQISQKMCKARMEGILLSLHNIKHKILMHARKILDSLKFNRPISLGQVDILKDFNVKADITLRAPILVRWNPPVNNYSLNVDGACKGNLGICGGGGCFRDHNGDFVCGFAFFYGIGNSLIVETRAIHDGLRLAMERHLNIWLFLSRLSLMVSYLTGQSFLGGGGICHILQTLKPKIVHTFREGNQVADSLASQACVIHRNSIFLCLSDLPTAARGSLIIDKAGLPSFRQRL
ncbi:hypothetical protein Taro_019391 [Colocasia esculenta]|uniref:RNase H type-1 domain-containing protein n=1 Tax=Colocasia esculenta TaxID=4460 RepID=A0A843UKZ7_COLES|nr:hypothetical protein [Colocasia esculenta]